MSYNDKSMTINEHSFKIAAGFLLYRFSTQSTICKVITISLDMANSATQIPCFYHVSFTRVPLWNVSTNDHCERINYFINKFKKIIYRGSIYRGIALYDLQVHIPCIKNNIVLAFYDFLQLSICATV